MSSAYSFAVDFAASLPKKAVWPDSQQGSARVSEQDAAREQAVMGVAVSTSPPLGQVTQLARGEAVVVYAMLETAQKGRRWQMALHHTASGSRGAYAEWRETVLSPVAEQGNVQRVWALQADDGAVERHYFRASLAMDGLFQFTAKFREAGQPAWRWVRDEQGTDDGTVVVNGGTSPTYWLSAELSGLGQAPVAEPGDRLGDLVRDLNPDLEITRPPSQVAGTQLWCMEALVARSEHDVSAYTDVTLGLPWGEFLRWFALVRNWTPWLAPRQGHTRLALDRDAVLCSFWSPTGRHMVFLAVSGIRHLQSVFQHDDAGRLVLHVRSDSLDEEKATVLVAVADSFEQANAAVLYHARQVVQPWRQQHTDVISMLQSVHQEDQDVVTSDHGDVHAHWMETWYDGLGYCTWNGLGRDLTEARLVSAMDDLAAHGIRIASLIIDDNWQALDRSGGGQFQHSWMGFEADPYAFPFGLAHAVQAVRLRHPHIRHVAVWHALLGYWGGVSPHGELAERYATLEIPRDHPPRRNLPISGPMTVVAGEGAADVRRLYDDFYRFLAACGVDGVKTDAQFMMDAWSSARARRELTGAYADAWAVAAMRHLQARAISCMSQTPTLLFHAQLPQGPPALPVRNSDDFFPEIPSSHPWHVWSNALNSLLTQHLNVLPDWDMFQTVHDYSAFHAAARCVSGGPIYITDVPGQHDIALLNQIAAPGLADGRHAVIFRPSVIGRALDPYVGYHDNVLLKVGAYHGSASGSGLLGLFNISDRPLSELVPLARVPGVRLAGDNDNVDNDTPKPYLARVHSTGRLTAPVHADALLAISLDVRGHEIVSVYQPTAFAFPDLPQPGGSPLLLYVATLGLVRKMAAAASVVRTSAMRRSTGPSIELTASFKALGIVGIYVSALPTMTVQDNFLITIRGLVIPAHCVSKSAQDPHVLEIDAERAWDEMGQTPGWNNELHLTVLITVR